MRQRKACQSSTMLDCIVFTRIVDLDVRTLETFASNS